MFLPTSYHIDIYAQKSEIERMVAEMLEAGIIRPSQSSFSAIVVMVLKKEGAWRMYPNYRELNKLTIKDNFPLLSLMNCWMNYMEQSTSPS